MTAAGLLLKNLRDLHRTHPQSFLDDVTLDGIEKRALSRGRRARVEVIPK